MEVAEGPLSVPSSVTTKKKWTGIFSRLWRGIFGRRIEDYEKWLQHLSEEEAAVQARMTRRADTSRRVVWKLFALCVIIEVFAVAYVIMTPKAEDLNLKTRAMRALPMILLPGLCSVMCSTFASVTRMFDLKDQKKIERLRAERKAMINELKERTNYHFTRQLIQKYGIDPVAKAAAAQTLASKLNEDPGSEVSVVDEPKNKTPLVKSGSDAEPTQTAGLRNRKQSLTRSAGNGSTVIPRSSIENPDVVRFSYGREAPYQIQVVVEHYQVSVSSNGGRIARRGSLLVADDPLPCCEIMCGNRYVHNGLARQEDYPLTAYPRLSYLSDQQR